jgi:hypothetical protein
MIDSWTASIAELLRAADADPDVLRADARRHVPEWSLHSAALGARFAAAVRAAATAGV